MLHKPGNLDVFLDSIDAIHVINNKDVYKGVEEDLIHNIKL